MCFNAALAQSAELIEALYGIRFPEEKFSFPSYFTSAYEHPRWPVLKQGNRKSFVPAVWGLIPSWISSPEKAALIRDRTINARFESLETKPSFRGLIDRRRCGVLVDGFVEWRQFEGEKYPYHIALPGKRPFLLAGIWDRWEDGRSGSELETFSVITVEAKGLPALIHNTKLRMPLILGKESGKLWLDPVLSFTRCAGMMVPFYRSLEAWPVGRGISSPAAAENGPEVQEPFDYPELPSLEGKYLPEGYN